MISSGIGTPYWYEWEIGIIECLHMMTDLSIESVTLQSSEFQSLDDVVIKYTDGSITNIQVKHTDVECNMTYSSLEQDGMLNTWALEWDKEKNYHKINKICIITNRKWGSNSSGGKCSLSDFIKKVLPKLKEDLMFSGENEKEKNAIEWYKNTIKLSCEETNKFIRVLEFKNEEDLSGLESEIKKILIQLFGTDKDEVIRNGIDRLRSRLETWATSRREKPEITREDIYRVLCDPCEDLPKYELYPQKPIFPSRIEFAKSFIMQLMESNKKIAFLQGAPGSGKTNFISYLAQLENTIVDFRYYTYLPVNMESPSFSDDEGFYDGKTLWSSILYQLKKKFEELNVLSELRFPLLYDHLSVTELRLYVLKYLPIYAKKCSKTCYLFIDGMDHAARTSDNRNTFLSQLPRPDEIEEGVKFIFVGQPINDKYPNWLLNKSSVDYYELPLLLNDDIKTIIEKEKIEIDSVDVDTLATSVVRVVGNNTLNVLFAILEIKKMSTSIDFDNIISTLESHGLNGYIDRYYEWIVSAINTDSEVTLLKLEAIFAFSSRKIPVNNLALICETDIVNVECVLHKLYPLIVSDAYGYYVFHNDVRLYFKETVRSNSNLINIIDSISAIILKNTALCEYKYDILFDLSIESQNLNKIFEFYNPDYIIESINYQISINKLVNQFKRVVELMNCNRGLDVIHKLSLVATSISKLIECVRYYEKENQFIEDEMPQRLTLSEKYVLNPSTKIKQITNDIYQLLKSNAFERASKLFDEYLCNNEITELLSDDETNKNDFDKIGYIYRTFNPDVLFNLPVEKCYVSFVSGWLEASVNYCSKSDLQQTFTFKKCKISDLYKYVSDIIRNPKLSNDSVICLSEFLCKLLGVSLHTLTELCYFMILKRIPSESIQAVIYNSLSQMQYIDSLESDDFLDYKVHGVLCYFKIYFCLYNYNQTIKWDTIYEETIKRKHITSDDRGYKPAIALKELSMRLFKIFYDKDSSYDDLLKVTYDLTFFIQMYGAGSCSDCGAWEVIPYLKSILLQFFINNPDYPNMTKLCNNLMQVFIGKAAIYVDELAQIYYLSGNKKLYLQIAEHWCGAKGIVWKNEYNDIESICGKIIKLLNKFTEFKFANEIKIREQIKLLGYVGHKDYTINGLLECYKHLPNNERKIMNYGMELLSISDYVNEMGDNRINVYDELFDVANELGYEYLDALFELKNTPDDLVYWRQRLLETLYNKIDKLSSDDSQLFLLYKLTNAWINAEVEQHALRYKNVELETLYDYNKKLIKLISNPNLKEKLLANGNCTPTYNNTDLYQSISNHENKYLYIIDQLDSYGYTSEFENEFSIIINNSDASLYRLIIDVMEHIPDQNKKHFISKYVIPYLHLKNDYGYYSNGQKYIIEHIYLYLDKEEWIELFKDISDRIFKAMNDFDYFYSINEDLEFFTLHYYLQNHLDLIEQLFTEKCNMHFSFISSAGTLEVNHRKLIIDDTINTFSDFVKKQLGNVSL